MLSQNFSEIGPSPVHPALEGLSSSIIRPVRPGLACSCSCLTSRDMQPCKMHPASASAFIARGGASAPPRILGCRLEHPGNCVRLEGVHADAINGFGGQTNKLTGCDELRSERYISRLRRENHAMAFFITSRGASLPSHHSNERAPCATSNAL